MLLCCGIRKPDYMTSIAMQQTHKQMLPRQQRMKSRSRYNEQTELLNPHSNAIHEPTLSQRQKRTLGQGVLSLVQKICIRGWISTGSKQ
jgi:hypothetical protein